MKNSRSIGKMACAVLVGWAFALCGEVIAQQQPQPQPPAVEVKPAPSAEVKPAPPPAPPGPAPQTEVIENPYGIDALWRQGDFVARGTLIILIIMSIGSWYIGIVKLIEQARVMKDAREANAKFWHAGAVKDGVVSLREDSAFRFIAEEGQIALKDHSAMPKQQLDLASWLTLSLDRAIDVINNRLQTGLAFLATVGSTAPFVGLFGTVWGIYHALTAIGVAGQASIDKVAGPVGEALIMTALGLAVAVPAVLGYNWLVRRNRVAMEHVRRFSSGVQMTLLGGGHSPHRA
jgi:biopolymer transport protein ExbB